MTSGFVWCKQLSSPLSTEDRKRRKVNMQMKDIEQCFPVVCFSVQSVSYLSLWLRSNEPVVAAQMKFDNCAVSYCDVVYCAAFRAGG